MNLVAEVIRHGGFFWVFNLKSEIFAEECNKSCFAGIASDVDFSCFVLQHSSFNFCPEHKTNYTTFFYNNNIS